MPKPLKKSGKLPTPPKPRRPSDPNRAAHAMMLEHLDRVQEAQDQPVLDPKTVISEHMRKLGAKGGKVSGAKRMEMPAKLRKEIARKGATALWAKRKNTNK